MDRFSKALNERIYLLSASQLSNEEWNFNIRGQSNKVYKQILTPNKFSCACPDHCLRKGFCKHLLFLFCRVSLNTTLAKELFLKNKEWDIETFTIINKSFIERLKHRIETNKPKEITSNAIGSDCSICFEEMKNGEVFSQCLTTCKNYFHEDCINLWLNSGHETCPLCRGEWTTTAPEEINIEISLLTTQTSLPTQRDRLNAVDNNNITINNNIIVDDAVFTPSRTQIIPTTDIITSYNNIRIIKSCDDANIKDVCSRNNIEYKNGNIYYEFLKAEKINNKKRIILMDKRNNDLFEGGCARDIMGLSNLDDNIDINIKPGALPDFIIFIQSTSPNRKILKNQMIIKT